DPLAQLRNQPRILVVARPARTPVRDTTLSIDGREIQTDRDVARLEREIDTQRREHTATDVVALGVIAEQRQVARTTARRDAVAHGLVQPERRTARKRIQIRR